MAAAVALANRHIISTTLLHLSNMKYKDRRQQGPEQPVALLEFRPTLVPSILVNRLWADEGTSILWRRYPHLPALREMTPERRQYYANKVSQIFSLSPPPGHAETLEYLDGLQWPNLKVLELEVDFCRHGARFVAMLHSGLERLEMSGTQSGGASYFQDSVLPSLLKPCPNLKSLKLGPGIVSLDEPLPARALFPYLDTLPSLETIQLRGAGFDDTDPLFTYLQQRRGLKSIEIDLEPGLALLPQLEGLGDSHPFPSLTHLDVMCYPETALKLLPHLPLIETLQLDICRIPERPIEGSDYTIIDDLISAMSLCSHLQSLKIGVGPLAFDFPSAGTFPQLNGGALIRLAKQSPNLEDINLFASEPSALDASGLSSDDFEQFCQSLPQLRCLILKLDPMTATSLSDTALESLRRHCHDLELLRLRIPCLLTNLPEPGSLPSVLVGCPNSDISGASVDSRDFDEGTNIVGHLKTTTPSQFAAPSLFPHLTHLAIARPNTVLYETGELFANGSQPSSPNLDPQHEEETVRAWALALLTHFPSLEILEAWSDWTGNDNESLNYFLPTEEILASTWEFLSGVEQNLWDDGFDEDESWQTSETRDDWDAASNLNEYPAEKDSALDAIYIEEEPEDMITPGRTLDADEYFRYSTHHDDLAKATVLHDGLSYEDVPAAAPAEQFGTMKIA